MNHPTDPGDRQGDDRTERREPREDGDRGREPVEERVG